MADGSDGGTATVLASIHDVAAGEWDACAGGAGDGCASDAGDDGAGGAGDGGDGGANPFVGHAFLAALEDSGSATGARGWLPRHLVLRAADGRLDGCMPLYLKSHSYGEYVFDWGWAEAFEQAGGRYYPKLQAAVPFTPVTGPRLLVRPGAPAATAARLAAAAIELAKRLGVSSLHVTFAPPDDLEAFAARGCLLRLGHQYHWQNQGYRSFDDFLAALASRKRKAIRREREAVARSGVRIRTLTGDEIGERHWQAFWHFYQDTVERKWAHAYLTRDFFFRLGETLADRVVLVIAETPGGQPVGGALNLLGPDALYGRYWGCAEAHRFLHFELCFYRAIDFAIDRGLARVEAGAQGEHKIQRGYLPAATCSAHWIAHAGLRRAVERFLAAERPAVQEQMAALAADSPFRRADG